MWIRIRIWCVFGDANKWSCNRLSRITEKQSQSSKANLVLCFENCRWAISIFRKSHPVYVTVVYVILGSEEINDSLSETWPLRCGPTTRDRKIYDKARLNFFHANNQPTNASAFLCVHTYSCNFGLKIREWEKGLSYKRTFTFIYLPRDWTVVFIPSKISCLKLVLDTG